MTIEENKRVFGYLFLQLSTYVSIMCIHAALNQNFGNYYVHAPSDANSNQISDLKVQCYNVYLI